MKQSAFCLAVLGLASLGCGSDPDSNGPGNTGALLPWAEGNTWTYRVTSTDDGTATNKVTTVGALEEVGGTGPHSTVMANKVVTEKADGADETISWQGKSGSMIVRYREQAFDMAGGMVELEEHWSPYKLRVDSAADKREKNKSWLEEYEETKIDMGVEGDAVKRNDRWFVDQALEKVTVPAGEFDAVLLRRVSGSGSVKSYWFAPGVGKVKETGGNQIEELVEYELKD